MLLSLSYAHSVELDPTDISILMPLPNDITNDHMLRADSQGKFGEFLPKTILEHLPRLSLVEDNILLLSQLRVIGVRFDPCFPLNPPKNSCQPQIRLVWQPIEKNGDQAGTRTVDVTIHSFYNLTKEELNSALAQIQSLNEEFKVSHKDAILNIHPVLQSRGLDSPYGTKLLSIIRSVTGNTRLVRVTSMAQVWFGNVWSFSGNDIVDGKMVPMVIPRTSATTQTFFNKAITTASFSEAGMDPVFEGVDSLAFLVQNSDPQNPIDQKKALAAYASATRAENPLLHSPNTVDCVSCHIAQPAKLSARTKFPALDFDAATDTVKFKSKYNLSNITNSSTDKTTLLRSFGYAGDAPVISQRVVNETAQILELLEKNTP